MKRILMLLTFVVLSVVCFGQNSQDVIVCPQKLDSAVMTVSGAASTISFRNDCGAVRVIFGYDITGAPATTSIVLSGCMRGLAGCTVLETSTVTTSGIRSPAITVPYDYFIIVPSWTGGTAPTFAAHMTASIA